MEKLTLTDADISTSKLGYGSQRRPSFWSKTTTVVAALAIGTFVTTGCSDPSGSGTSCTDSDVGRFDTGTNADPYDFGGRTDPIGSGVRCSDSD